MRHTLKLQTPMKQLVLILLATGIYHSAIAQEKQDTQNKGVDNGKGVDTATIERIMGIKGKSNNGEYKITIPQNDLDVKVDGFKIIPAMGLGTWVAFTPT